MSDTTTVENRGRGEAVADRLWIDSNNTEVESPEEATGFRYVDKASGRAYVWQSKRPAGEAVTMLAIFGGLTKAGNIRSTLFNKDPRTDIIQGISDWFDELDNGTWSADRVGGGVRYNAEVLAKAIANVKGEHHPGAEKPYFDKITAKLKVADPGKKNAEISYASFAMRNKAVEAEYNKLLPQHEAAPAVSDL